MKKPQSPESISFGLANSRYLLNYIDKHRSTIDYVEVAFEQMRHDSSCIENLDGIQIIMHCASMSLASDLDRPKTLVGDLKKFQERVNSPWIGEHVAFVDTKAFHEWDEETFHVEYTVSPQLTDPILERLKSNTQNWTEELATPIILENGPIYFSYPNSKYSQPEFISKLVESHDGGLLLDLTHAYISARNLGIDPIEFVDGFPLDKVIEVHISGVYEEGGQWWDNHMTIANEDVWSLAKFCASKARPKAVTLEYNWAPDMDFSLLANELDRARRTFS